MRFHNKEVKNARLKLLETENQAADEEIETLLNGGIIIRDQDKEKLY